MNRVVVRGEAGSAKATETEATRRVVPSRARRPSLLLLSLAAFDDLSCFRNHTLNDLQTEIAPRFRNGGNPQQSCGAVSPGLS
jgi:hypothetical protein